MNYHLVAAFLALAGSLPAFARIGDNLAACTARYGEPGDPTEAELECARDATAAIFEPPVRFKMDDISVLVSLFDNKVEQIVFIKDADKTGERRFIREEIDVLLKANGSGKEWKLAPLGGPGVDWMVPRAGLFAHYRAGVLTISTSGYTKRLKDRIDSDAAAKKAKATKKLEKF